MIFIALYFLGAWLALALLSYQADYIAELDIIWTAFFPILFLILIIYVLINLGKKLLKLT